MDYQSYITWLETVPLYGKKDGVRNMVSLLQELGNPQRQMPVIHVAGTNGKGSCCAMLAQILRESGYRVGLYTSPHLVEYTERIQLDGRQIEKERWLAIGLEVKAAAEKIAAAGENHATFFEIITAMAFSFFASEKADVVVLETGVGGRLDATNVIESPELCLITSISLDHTKVLGETLPEIAAEKAGIIKRGVPVVLAENPREVQQVVQQQAEDVGSDFYYAPAELEEIPPLRLAGAYQQQNAAAVLRCAQLLLQKGWRITEETIRRGLANTHWPGRMERSQFQGKPLLLDGAHNPGGAHMLAEYLEKQYEKGSCTLVFSALAKKDAEHILGQLRDCSAIGRVVFTCIDGEDQTEAFVRIWQASAEGRSKSFCCVKQPQNALETAVHMPETELTVCAGSLYLIGEIESVIR
ncbi:MAG: bifunctional folylpolyglutamate synthase/dihydrofolate synthase [Lachnospiraceae bacterium]|jgi:dihydrofolate synthase/folylpolyglutamate synthase|nr:bifunctional folylpolyglutamate synthase/dihydrofolate synthase [Lachnospiraceae bacterium]